MGLSDDVARGVKGILRGGMGTSYSIQSLEGGGALVHRFVPGSNTVSAAIWTYTLDASGAMAGMAKQAYEATGAIPNTLKIYK